MLALERPARAPRGIARDQYAGYGAGAGARAEAYDEFAPASVVIAGGVAASKELRRQLSEALPLPIEYPDFKLCTDNGAMIATLGCFHVKTGQKTADPYTLDIAPNLSM